MHTNWLIIAHTYAPAHVQVCTHTYTHASACVDMHACPASHQPCFFLTICTRVQILPCSNGAPMVAECPVHPQCMDRKMHAEHKPFFFIFEASTKLHLLACKRQSQEWQTLQAGSSGLQRPSPVEAHRCGWRACLEASI